MHAKVHRDKTSRDLYLVAVSKHITSTGFLKTEADIKSYIPKKKSQSILEATKKNLDPIKMFYTALGESYMPTREEYDFVTKGGTSGGQKFVPRLALAIARNRATPKMDVYYRKIEELSKTYKIMKKNPWVLNRILRVFDRGFLKPTKPALKKEYQTQNGLCAYVFPNRWETFLSPLTTNKRKVLWTERTALVRGMIESEWLENTFPMFRNRVFVNEVILLTEDDVQYNNTNNPSLQNTVRYIKPKLWGTPPPSIKPHVSEKEKTEHSVFVKTPRVHVYEHLESDVQDLFLFIKSTMPRWRIPTDSGFLLENVLETGRKDKESERNMKRRATPITQLKDLLDEETSEEIGFPNSSADVSGSEEELRSLELFEYLENPITPIQIYRWGTVNPGSEKEFLDLCHSVEKERQEIQESLAEDLGEAFVQPDLNDVKELQSDENAFDDKNNTALNEDVSEDTHVTPFTDTLSAFESSRISLKTRKYFTSPRSKSDSSYHRSQVGCPLPMNYTFKYFLNRWPKSTNVSLDGWVSEVKRILFKCDGVLSLLEKKDFQLVSGLVETIQSELVQNLKNVDLPIKDGRTLNIGTAYTKSIMRSGNSATAESIATHSRNLVSMHKKKAFPLVLAESAIKKTLPVLDIKKVFTGGGTRKHSVVNHVTERRAGFNTIRWASENAFKNPRNTHRRAAAALSKEIISMFKSGKPSYAQQQRSKVYTEIWALMGRPDQLETDDENKKTATKDSKKNLGK
jgi:ribosomal protein S7